MSKPAICTRPPAGWRCTRAARHLGPCAALPVRRSIFADLEDTSFDIAVGLTCLIVFLLGGALGICIGRISTIFWILSRC